MTQLQECLANNMKRYRKLCGFSQEKLAEKAHASANYIALIESGKSFPSLQMLENIASALDVSAIDLFDKKSLSFPVNEDLRKKLLEDICLVVNNAFDEMLTASAWIATISRDLGNCIRLHKILLDTLSPTITKAISDAMLQADTLQADSQKFAWQRVINSNIL